MNNAKRREILKEALISQGDDGVIAGGRGSSVKSEKKVLITGGSRGIGAATVKKFVSVGYETVFLYKEDKKSADEILKFCSAAGNECTVHECAGSQIVQADMRMSPRPACTAYRCDVSDPDTVRELREKLEKTNNAAFDTLVCNAGIGLSGLFTDMTVGEWNRLRGVNLDGAVNVLCEFLPQLVSKKRGSVILISSMWGRAGASCEAGYSATKAALIGLAKSLAKELGPSGIRVNCVAPGLIDTDMNADLNANDIQELIDQTPIGRMGTPRDVAELIAFLASDKAAFITGQVIGVDGGFVI